MPRQQHFLGLDLLRGLGALTVVVFHMKLFYFDYGWLKKGYLSVDLFFLLSGFVLAHVYEGKLKSGSLMLGRYARIRLLRVYPLLLIGLMLGLIAIPLRDIEMDHLFQRGGLHLVLLPSIAYAGPIFWINAPHWSLFFELAVNAVHAVLVPILSNTILMTILIVSAIVLTVCIFVLGSVDIGVVKRNFFAGIPRTSFGFFGGIALYRLWCRRVVRVPNWLALTVVASAPVLMLVAGFVPQQKTFEVLTVVVLLPAIVLCGSYVELSGESEKVALLVGRLSYPIYAIHEPIVETASTVIVKMGVVESVLSWALVMITIVCLAWCLDRWYDEPLRRMLMRRRFGLPSSQSRVSP